MKHNLNLKISRGETVDPLIINYSGRVADFKEKTFEVDLDADGNKENIPFLKEGSGFLVLIEEGETCKRWKTTFLALLPVMVSRN